MTREHTRSAIARRRRLDRVCVLFGAMLSSSAVLLVSVLMVTGPAGLA